MPESKQTDRLLRALDNRHVSILGHPTGRLLLSREACDVDMEKVIARAKDSGVALELNAHPERLDLSDVLCQQAKAAGARVAISSDAHATHDFGNLRYGISQARRGWLSKHDVLNSLSLENLIAALRR